MKGLWRLLISAVLLVGLIAAVRFWPSHEINVEPANAPLAAFDPGKAERIDIAQPQKPEVILNKEGGSWKLVQPYAAAADQNAVSTLLSTLSGLAPTDKLGKQSDLSSFGLTSPTTVTIGLNAGQTRTFAFGSDAPTGGSVYAAAGGSHDVVAIPSYTKSDAVRSAFDLQDKSVLHLSSDKVNQVKLTRDGKPYTFARKDGKWPEDHKDAIQTLLDALQSAQMNEATDPSGKDAAKYGLAHPAAVLTLVTQDGSQSLSIGSQKKPSDYYARASSGPMIFTVSDYLVKDVEALTKAPEKKASEEKSHTAVQKPVTAAKKPARPAKKNSEPNKKP